MVRYITVTIRQDTSSAASSAAPARPLLVNVDKISAIWPRHVQVQENKLINDKSWIEQGCYMAIGGMAEGDIAVLMETYRQVLDKLRGDGVTIEGS